MSYLVMSFYSDGSQKPKLSVVSDHEFRIGDLLNHVWEAIRDDKHVEVYKVSEDTLIELIFSTMPRAQEEEDDAR